MKNPNLLLLSTIGTHQAESGKTVTKWRPHALSGTFQDQKAIFDFLKTKPGSNIVLVKGHVNFDGSVGEPTRKEISGIMNRGCSAAIIVPNDVNAVPVLIRTQED